MKHPNILKLYGFFDDNKNIYLILEYCSQCLFKDFRSKVKLSEEETAYYGKQVISALKYMHNESIIHRDIKPQNIMIQHGVLKMSDFGWSTYAPTQYFFFDLANAKLSVGLSIMFLLKSQREVSMIREQIFGLWEFYCISWLLVTLLLKLKTKI